MVENEERPAEDAEEHAPPESPEEGVERPEPSAPAGRSAEPPADLDETELAAEPPETIPAGEEGGPSDPRDRFRTLVTSEDDPDSEEAESQAGRHPTGQPELTGGWFAHDPPAELEPEDPDQTRLSAVEGPPPDPEATRRAGADEAPAEAARDQTPTPPPMLGTTPPRRKPALGTQGMPLPRRVDEIDVDATRVTPSAYRAARPVERTIPPAAPPAAPPAVPKTRAGGFGWSRALGCLVRMGVLALFAAVVVTLAFGSFALYEYYQIAATLPSVDDLRLRASQFETTRILDRNGNVLYEILDPTAGRRTYVPLDRISPFMVASIIATEDKDFYSNPGFDPLGIARAFLQNFQSGETVSGASTITQQLARTLLFTPEERSELSYMRKVREALLANEITRRYSKDEILELYLNEINFGNLAYGVEAAAQTYFGTSADKLTLFQSAFLAGLPQAPSVYDVYTNREVTKGRFQQVLVLMYEASSEQNCISVSNNLQPVCVDEVAAATAYGQFETYEFNPPDVQIRYPHWVNYVRAVLESQYDPQTIYRSGFTVFTTLDPGLQDQAEQIVLNQVNALSDRHVTNGALVAIRPPTGEILAMVGSADFYNEDIDGQVNMAVAPRQPGSAIKPLTYTAAFERGWTPSTLIWDVPSEFPPSGDPNDPRPPYKPVNYDGRFHGPVMVRSALANSYNVPAVKTLDFVGVFDDPTTPEEDGLVAFARRLGISTLTRNDYGLALTLGGGDVTLLELTGAYAVYATGGRRVPPVAITRIVDNTGNVVFEYQPPPGEQVIRPEHAFLISNILSDPEARTPAFGRNSVLNLPFTAAAKTGTTNDFRDNWTLGYTPDVVVGAWVGNADYTPMQNTSGVTGAGPIWAEFMQAAVQQLTGGNPASFVRPAGVVERVICSASGTEPSRWCPDQRSEFFVADQPPRPAEEDLWQRILVDTWTGLRASAECAEFVDEQFAVNVTDPWAIRWIRETEAGRNWASSLDFEDPLFFVPTRDCTAGDPRPLLSFASPDNGATITESPLDIFGQVAATADFRNFSLEFGRGDDPAEWESLTKRDRPFTQPDLIYTWDLVDEAEGVVTLRLYMESIHGTFAEKRLRLRLQVPTPTPTPTPTFTPTPTPTETPTPTLTPTPTWTPTITPTPTVTPPPTTTPSETPPIIPIGPPTVTPTPP